MYIGKTSGQSRMKGNKHHLNIKISNIAAMNHIIEKLDIYI